MGRIIIVPDSFKGTMSSIEICDIVRRGLEMAGIEEETVLIPVADGGEGTVDAFLQALGGELVHVRAHDALMRDIDSFYGLLPDGKTAVVEMAAASGLPLVRGHENAVKASSYGTGELMLDAARRGIKHMIVGLGGSATTDGGVGMASALGVRFLDEAGNELAADHEGLERVHTVDLSGVCEKMRGISITVACDVDNPLTGPRGAAAVFGPQKGATDEDIPYLDKNLSRLAAAVERSIHKKLDEYPGAGAAGGMGFALLSMFGAQLTPGIDVVLDTVEFEKKLESASLVITGEGRIDGQSAAGKVPVGVSRRAQRMGVPVIAIVGDIGDGSEGVYDLGITSVFSINRVARDYKEMRLRAKDDLYKTAFDIGRLIKTFAI